MFFFSQRKMLNWYNVMWLQCYQCESDGCRCAIACLHANMTETEIGKNNEKTFCKCKT